MASPLNTIDAYGWVARVLHWAMAIAIVAMFALGLWMRNLGYYDPWYQAAPDLHRSIGIVLAVLLVLRFLWRLANPEPSQDRLTPLERLAAKAVHRGFYLLLVALMLAGYLISTLDGRSIEVFGLFTIPSLYENKGMEEIAGTVHEYLAYAVIALAALHALAALKHHFIDRNDNLTRMISGRSGNEDRQAGLS